VLGCSQRLQREAAQQRLKGRAELLVRESGGGAVLTGPWLVAVSVVLPPGHPWLAGGLLESYRQLGQLHGAALAAFGIAARALAPQELPRVQQAIGVRPVDWACFGSLSPWEVVSADGRKLVGLAQRRRQSGVLLVAGTLLDVPDWPLLCDALGQSQEAQLLRQRTVSGAELAQRQIPPEQFAEVLTQGLEHALT
jgi:lipoate---protein ligase